MKNKKTKPQADQNIQESTESKVIKQILRESVEQYQAIVEKQNRPAEKDVTKIEGFLCEYFDDYLIIGHTPNEERVVLRYASTIKDFDALNELVKQVCFKIMAEVEKNTIDPEEEDT